MGKARSLGEVIKEVRLQKFWSQAKLAKKANVAVGTVWALEHGRGTRGAQLERIVKALGLTAQALTKGRIPTTTTSPTDAIEKGLDDEAIDIAFAFMKARTEIRALVLTLLQHGRPPRDLDLTPLARSLAMRLIALSPDRLALISDMLRTFEQHAALSAAAQTSASVKR